MHSPEEGTRVDRKKGEREGNKDTQFESQTNVSTMSTKKGKGLKIVSEGGKVSKEGKVYTRILELTYEKLNYNRKRRKYKELIHYIKFLTGIDEEAEELGEFMQGGIKIKTMLDHTKEIKRFQEYLARRGMEARVENYLLDPREGTKSAIYDQTRELVTYAMRLSQDETLSPSAFDAQFHAIYRFMVTNLRDTSVFETEGLKEARRIARGIVTGSRKRMVEAMGTEERRSYEARYAQKLPFTEEMIMKHRDTFWVAENATVEDKMAYIATALGYHLGNRPSEETSNGPRSKDKSGNEDADHRYIVEDIQYQMEDGSFITGPDIVESNKHGIQYISVMVNTHKGETLKMLTSNKGSSKRGANAVRNDNGPMECQLFNDLIEWPSIAKLEPKDVYFSRNSTNKKNLQLTTKAMVTTMKATAESLGVDPNLISGKSLRKALGTDMTRSNVPNETMNKLGRWAIKSTVGATIYAAATAGNVTGTMSEGITRTSLLDLQRTNRNRDKMTAEQHRG